MRLIEANPFARDRVDPEAESAVVKIAFDSSDYGQSRACNECLSKALHFRGGCSLCLAAP